MSDALLALLDDAAFRTFDLLRLTEAVRADYKQLVEALSRRFASTTGEPALRFQLGQRHQEATKMLDESADALLDLTNRHTLSLTLTCECALLATNLWPVCEQTKENLLQTSPDSLEDAHKVAKRLEAARAARRQMQTSNKARAVHSLESNPDSEDESPRSTGREVTMVTRTDQALLEAVQ